MRRNRRKNIFPTTCETITLSLQRSRCTYAQLGKNIFNRRCAQYVMIAHRPILHPVNDKFYPEQAPNTKITGHTHPKKPHKCEKTRKSHPVLRKFGITDVVYFTYTTLPPRSFVRKSRKIQHQHTLKNTIYTKIPQIPPNTSMATIIARGCKLTASENNIGTRTLPSRNCMTK